MAEITPATACALLLVLCVCCHLPPPAASLFFNYSTFSSQDQKDFRIEGDASFSVGRIDVSANRIDGIGNSAGRVSYNAQPMLLWDKATGEVASFTTRFSFAIGIPNINNKGKGMAFFLAGYPSLLPYDSYGFDLGLTNQSTDATATGDSRFVAVEFDTFNDTQVSDPDATYDHLGIDVNSVRSVVTKSLPSFSLMGNMTALIQYDNVSSLLSLTLWLGDGRGRNYSLSSKVDLKSALPEQVAVGFSAGTSSSVELHQLSSWYFSSSLEPKAVTVAPPSPRPGSGSGSHSSGVIAGASAGATLFLVLVIVTAVILIRRRGNKKKKREVEEDDMGSEDEDGDPAVEIEMGSTGPRRFPYQELVDATRNFAADEKLGQGGFGAVYRGNLKEPGLAVAIKRFSKDSSMQGKREYTSEINVISKLRHRNLVQLVGWCHGRNELLLVYELMPNRSLDIHLHGKGTFLTWPMRMKIVTGLGSALLYLHEEWEQCVVHRDIKPSNVMLDESFGAKLGDFGLARFIDHAVGTQTMTAVSGTPGYVDPQSMITGRASADLLEVACGRRPVSLLHDPAEKNGLFRLVEWVWDLYGRGALLDGADERLDGEYDKAEVERVMVAGLWCAHPDPSARPSMRAAMAVLQSKDANQLPVLPASMPVPTYGPLVSLPSGLSSFSVTQSTSTSGYGTHTSTSSDVSTIGSKDSSSLLKHQYS
ncbi:L-type lectin-domain containing receptor kinase IX.1-like [Triticum urartu]|uniref:non-specific serine/threonine protein kinase n=2 Tax=Triticum urartu TaxID=4572 RepID=A0A8R7Q0T3_TRIUA|nr:L-type lectin-domain containing receptor kinase IX.1-like [Triticum urartu]